MNVLPIWRLGSKAEKKEREPRRGHIALYDLASQVTQHRLYHILFTEAVTKVWLGGKGENEDSTSWWGHVSARLQEERVGWDVCWRRHLRKMRCDYTCSYPKRIANGMAKCSRREVKKNQIMKWHGQFNPSLKEKGIDAEYYQGLSLGCGIILETLINVIFKGMSHCALSYFRAFTLGVCVPCPPPPHLCLRECWAFLMLKASPTAGTPESLLALIWGILFDCSPYLSPVFSLVFITTQVFSDFKN